MLVNYVAVYGKVKDWFGSDSIFAALFAAVITMLLFIKRGLAVKRPILNFNLFKNVNVTTGLFLFLLLGVFTPAIFQSALSTNVLHFEAIRNAEINLFLIPGILVGCVFTFFWYRKNSDSYLLIILGFSAFVLYHIMMYTRFVNDLNIADFLIPSFVKGFALAILYISIGIYATSKSSNSPNTESCWLNINSALISWPGNNFRTVQLFCVRRHEQASVHSCF